MRTSRAFSLIELFVVVGIIAALAGLLFPVFAAVKKRAHFAVDVEQMRQVWLASTLYTESYNGEYAASLVETEPYATSRQVYVSPVDPYRNGIPGVADFPANMYDGTGGRSLFRISYAYLISVARGQDHSESFLKEAVENPNNGLISMAMYNPLARLQFDNEGIDYYRRHELDYRVRIDGSFGQLHMLDGESIGCSMNFLFGPGLPVLDGF
jgi:type II secretory pathway pseudopilin PulG